MLSGLGPLLSYIGPYALKYKETLRAPAQVSAQCGYPQTLRVKGQPHPLHCMEATLP